MKIALISDIHSNYESLSKLINKIENESLADVIYCLGDIIGYGPNPAECLDLTLNLCEIILKGNHEEALTKEITFSTFNQNAKLAILYTLEKLNKDQMSIISQFPYTHHDDHAYYSHSSYSQPESWIYLYRKFEIEDELENLSKGKPLFFGHSHQPLYISQDKNYDYKVSLFNNPLVIEKDKKYIINIGSIGQPRDGNPAGSFAIFNTDSSTVTLHRVNYDTEKVCNQIKAVPSLPDILGERLLYGK